MEDMDFVTGGDDGAPAAGYQTDEPSKEVRDIHAYRSASARIYYGKMKAPEPEDDSEDAAASAITTTTTAPPPAQEEVIPKPKPDEIKCACVRADLLCLGHRRSPRHSSRSLWCQRFYILAILKSIV